MLFEPNTDNDSFMIRTISLLEVSLLSSLHHSNYRLHLICDNARIPSGIQTLFHKKLPSNTETGLEDTVISTNRDRAIYDANAHIEDVGESPVKMKKPLQYQKTLSKAIICSLPAEYLVQYLFKSLFSPFSHPVICKS